MAMDTDVQDCDRAIQQLQASLAATPLTSKLHKNWLWSPIQILWRWVQRLWRLIGRLIGGD
jgi:hypothetical protein